MKKQTHKSREREETVSQKQGESKMIKYLEIILDVWKQRSEKNRLIEVKSK